MQELNIQQSIMEAVNRMSLVQQIRLLEFVNSMVLSPRPEKPKTILEFSGVFDDATTREFELSLKDFQKIDHDEW